MNESNLDSQDPHPTPTVENYLMLMHVMQRDQGEIVAARLAEILKVAPATVAMTLKRMERDHWISGKGRKGGISLTSAGQAAAHSVVRRHMLTEWLLVKILQVPFLRIHAEAHHLEHSISEFLEEQLMKILESPQLCPHGNPMPGFEHAVSAWIPLNLATPGMRVTIRRLHEFAEENQGLLKYLIDNEITLGTEVAVIEVLPFNQTLTLAVGSRQVVLGFAAAANLFVEMATES